MWITTDEAVEMYARFLLARHGRRASELAREKASSLQKRGDVGGYKIWNEVADVTARRSPRDTRSPMAQSSSLI
jgi:hypothetical protein